MKFKSKRMIVLGLSLLLPAIYYSCKEDFFDERKSDSTQEFAEAREWYDTSNGSISRLKSGNKNLKVYIAPNWKEGLVKKPEKLDATTVETAIEANALVTFIDDECLALWKQTKDRKYKQSLTRFVYVKHNKTKKKEGFYMTIMPSLAYLKEKNFKPFYDNSYMDIDNNYSGYILYHNVDGSFSNGWKYKNGQITHNINHQETGQVFTTLKGGHSECQTFQYTALVEECTNWFTITEFGVNYSGTTCHYFNEAQATWEECVWIEDGSPDNTGVGVVGSPAGGYTGDSSGSDSDSDSDPVPDTDNPLDTAKTPCAVMRIYSKDVSANNVVKGMKGLTNMTNESAFIMQREEPYDATDGLFCSTYVRGDSPLSVHPEDKLVKGETYDAFAHTHTSQGGPIFSTGDLEWLRERDKEGYINDYSTLSYILVTHTDHIILNMMVTDWDKFRTYCDTQLDPKVEIEPLDILLRDKFKHGKDYLGTFLDALKDAGIVLYEADWDTPSEWKQLELTNDSIPTATKTDCQ